MKTELVKFETPELLAIEKSKAKQIKDTFEPMVQMLETFEEIYNEIILESKKGITRELCAKAKRARLDIGKVRIMTDKERLSGNAESQREIKARNGVAHVVTWAVSDREAKLKELETHFETQEKLRLESLQKERAYELSKYVEDADDRRLAEMDDDVWNAYLSAKKKEHEDRVEAEKQAELQRIENERIVKQRNERSRLLLNITGVKENPNMTFTLKNMLDEKMSNVVDFKDVLDCEEKTFTKYFEEFKCTEEDNIQYLENQRLENERLKKEAEAKEKEIEAERKKQAKILSEQKAESDRLAKIEADKQAKKQAELDARLKKEQEAKAKLEAELKAKKDAEIKAENERKEAELKAKKEAERLAKAPIKNQLNAWIDSFEIPNTKIEHYKKAIIEEKFKAFKKWAKNEIEEI